MRVIVTGATSFIGKAVTEELLSAGCPVFAIVRPESTGLGALKELARRTHTAAGGAEVRTHTAAGGAEVRTHTAAGGAEQRNAAAGIPEGQNRPPEETAERLTLIPMELRDIGSIERHPGLKGGADLWLHLGWEGAGSANRQDPAVQARNIGYALNALNAASCLGCSRFLFSGSQAEYGIAQGVMSEDIPCHPVSEYGKDKLEVCLRAGETSKDLGIGYIHARIFSVYGPGDHPWSLISTCLDTFLGGGHMELGACTQQWNFLHVKDAARALTALLLAKAPPGVYNVAGDDTRPLRKYIEEMYRLCGGMGAYEYGKRPPNAEGVVSLEPDTKKLKAATGFRQEISFEDGIRTMIGMYKENFL